MMYQGGMNPQILEMLKARMMGRGIQPGQMMPNQGGLQPMGPGPMQSYAPGASVGNLSPMGAGPMTRYQEPDEEDWPDPEEDIKASLRERLKAQMGGNRMVRDW